MKVRVRWNMPVGRQDVIKEEIVEVEKYERPGSIYLHFFPNDEVRVIPVSDFLKPSAQERSDGLAALPADFWQRTERKN